MKIFIVIFFIDKAGRRTRGQDFMLMKWRGGLDVGKYSFSRTINEWNELSTDCGTCVAMFHAGVFT